MAEIMEALKTNDDFCWSCQKAKPELDCSTCVRSFHISASCSQTKKMPEEDLDWRCPACIEVDQDIAQLKKMDKEYLNKLLNCVSNLLIEDEYLEQLLNVRYSEAKGTVWNPLDLTKVGQKTERREYLCIEEFWMDIKWIVHNTKIRRSGNEDAIKAIKWLVDFTKNEIYTIRLCHECYWNANQNPNDWFTMPCTKPHLLIWAKQKGSPYWPAKLMAINREKRTIDVQFFGEHGRSVFTSKDPVCYMYSEEHLSSIIGSSRVSYDEAIYEAGVYIENLIKKFGTFNYAQKFTELNVDKLDRHLYDMLPQAWQTLGYTEIPTPIAKSATGARRMTMAGNLSGKRRMTVSNRRKSIALNATPPQPTTNSHEVQSNKKRKLNDSSDLPVQNDPSLVPRARKTFPTPCSTPHTFIPPKNVLSFTHRPIQNTSFGTEEIKAEQTDPNLTDDLILHFSGSDDGRPSHSENDSEMVALRNAMSERNPRQMTDCIQSSLESTLVTLTTSSTNPSHQIQQLRKELEKQRLENDVLVRKNYQLEKDNADLITDLNMTNHKLCTMEIKNSELNAMNNVLIESATKYKTELGKVDRIQEEFKDEHNKRIAEIKKTKWCAVCGIPCGRYYCSDQCKGKYETHQRS